MSNIVLTNLRLPFVLILGIMVLFPLTQVSAEVVWEEDWEKPPFDEWIIQAYSYSGDTGFQPDAAANPPVVAGVFETNAPSDIFGDYWSGAVRNSSVAYGSWSFDWIVGSGSVHESYVNVFFILPEYQNNLTGRDMSGNYSGYMLNLQSGVKGPHPHNSIYLSRFDGGIIGMTAFDSAIEGSHHIEVTRFEDGEFNVYFDHNSTPIITGIDTTHTNSTKFAFGAWIGDSGIDNIVVADLTETTTTTTSTTTTDDTTTDSPTTTETGSPSFEFQVIVLGVAFLFIFSRKRRL